MIDKQAISAIAFTLIVRPMITRTLLGPRQLGSQLDDAHQMIARTLLQLSL